MLGNRLLAVVRDQDKTAHRGVSFISADVQTVT